MNNGTGTDLNPYVEWLGLPPTTAPNYFELLGLKVGEIDPAKAIVAADRQIARVRAIRPGVHAREWSALLDELQAAKNCLGEKGRQLAYLAAFNGTTTILVPTTKLNQASTNIKEARGQQAMAGNQAGNPDPNFDPMAPLAPLKPKQAAPNAGPLPPHLQHVANQATAAQQMSGAQTTANQPQVATPSTASGAPILSAPTRIRRKHRGLWNVAITLVVTGVLLGGGGYALMKYQDQLFGPKDPEVAKNNGSDPEKTDGDGTSKASGSDPDSEEKAPSDTDDSKSPSTDSNAKDNSSDDKSGETSPENNAPEGEPNMTEKEGDDEKMTSPTPETTPTDPPKTPDPSVPAEEMKKPETEPNPETPAPETPMMEEKKLSRPELYSLGKKLIDARRLLYARDIKGALATLDEAKSVVGDPAQLEMVERAILVTEKADELWQKVEEGAAKLQQQEELQFSATAVIVIIEASAEKIVYRAAGQREERTPRELPSGIAKLVAEKALPAGEPQTSLLLGVLYAAEMFVNPAKKDEAEALFRDAEQGEVDVKAYLAYLDDEYDLLKKLPPVDAPEEEKLTEAKDEVKKKYEEAVGDAKNPEKRLALVDQILEDATKLPETAVAFATFDEAARIAGLSGHASKVVEVFDAKEKWFKHDRTEGQAKLVAQACKAGSDSDLAKENLGLALELAEKAVSKKLKKPADELLDAAQAASLKTKDVEARAGGQQKIKELRVKLARD